MMNGPVKELKNKAMTLSPQDRELLAFALLDSLDDPYTREDREKWDERLGDLASGNIRGLTPDSFFHELKKGRVS